MRHKARVRLLVDRWPESRDDSIADIAATLTVTDVYVAAALSSIAWVRLESHSARSRRWRHADLSTVARLMVAAE